MTLRWTGRAEAQLVDAATYLERERSDAGRSFLVAVEQLVELIEQAPRAFPRVPGIGDGEIRRALVRRYRYWVIFEIADAEVIVLATWHSSRKPGSWNEDA